MNGIPTAKELTDKTVIQDALVDPEFRVQMQALKDMTAALNGVSSSPVVFSTDQDSVLNA